MQKATKIILASSSPRRIELLKSLGLKFKVIPADIEEKFDRNLSPVQIACKLAEEKAEVIKQKIKDSSAIIIAGDTIVVLGKKILGKPRTKKEAEQMLSLLSGKTHIVVTGLCVIQGKKKVVSHVSTKVRFHKSNKSIIRGYVNSGEPMDKAGAYAIQGKGVILVEKIQGDYFNVIGLPLLKLSEMLQEFGIKVL